MSTEIDWSKAPEGWKLVPIKPTPDMRSAAGKAELETVRERKQFYAGDSWAPMISAAPEYKPQVAEWTGEGLPPVGTVCEVMDDDGAWHRAEVRCHGVDRDRPVAICQAKGLMLWCRPGVHCRPLRTTEQIAADERLHKVRNACTAIADTLDDLRGKTKVERAALAVVEAMIDAGYRAP